ncbi:MAG: hypothetical protein CMO80_22495 [Verrucomicrobiales bacterium]|nr:hypothetical protein [Verrucomicrobiales bacterium]
MFVGATEHLTLGLAIQRLQSGPGGKELDVSSYGPFDEREGFDKWLSEIASAADSQFSAVIPQITGKPAGLASYLRYEWKCDALNQPSRVAAERLGFSFEGIFRQATIYKGRNRDTAWYSITDSEWPDLDRAFQAWHARHTLIHNFRTYLGRNEEFALLGLSCSQCHGSSDMPHPHWFQSFCVF